jgi:hypothetical protein
MTSQVNIILIGFLLMALSYNAMAEVTTLSIVTDSSWKSLDFDNDGWTSENYDDTWWQTAREDNYWATIEPGKMIWYPGTVRNKPDIAYFRNGFDIDGTEILNGKMYVGTEGDGTIYLFINGNSIEKITDANNLNPAEIDITSYLKPGKNVIAAKIDVLPGNTHLWALTGTIRYDKLAPGQPIN